MVTLNLYGKLKSELGFPSIRLNVLSVAEALGALEIQTKKLLPLLTRLEREYQVGYEVIINGRPSPYEQDLMRVLPVNEEHEVDIIPVICGGKSNWLQIIVGVAIIVAVSAVTGGAAAPLFGGTSSGGLIGGSTAIGAGGSFAWVGQGITMMGFSLVLGGISQMLIKPPSATTAEGQSEESYLFSGSFNRMSQGGPIPVLLGGPLRIGSQTINGFAQITEIGTGAGGDNLQVTNTVTYSSEEEFNNILDTIQVSDIDQVYWEYTGDGTPPHISYFGG